MSSPERGGGDERDPRVYFAAERTLLAWVRTGLSLMGFGFVVARFGLFLRELAAHSGLPPAAYTGTSQWIGIVLVVLGVLSTAAAAARHVGSIRRYNRGQHPLFTPVSVSVVLSGVLAVLGLVLVGYLLRLG